MICLYDFRGWFRDVLVIGASRIPYGMYNTIVKTQDSPLLI